VNERRIDEYYCQRIGPITELTKSAKLSGKIGTALLGFLQSEVASETGLGGRGTLTPILKAILLEREARNSGHLADLSFDSAEQRSLLTFVGESRFVDDMESCRFLLSTFRPSGGTAANEASIFTLNQDNRFIA